MKLLKKGIIGVGNTVLGYLTIPGLLIGFLLATNSSKGWGVENKDGQIFIPLGILLLIVFVLLVIIKLFKSVKRIKNRSDNFYFRYIQNNLFFVGMMIYLIHCAIV